MIDAETTELTDLSFFHRRTLERGPELIERLEQRFPELRLPTPHLVSQLRDTLQRAAEERPAVVVVMGQLFIDVHDELRRRRGGA